MWALFSKRAIILHVFTNFCNNYFLFRIKTQMHLYLVTYMFKLEDTLSSSHVLKLKFLCRRAGTQPGRVTFMANNKYY